jgi:hypothetical protein
MNCEYCNKKQKELNACNTLNMWLCDDCYSTKLNHYEKELDVVERMIYNKVMKKILFLKR